MCLLAGQGYAKVAVLGRDVVYIKLQESTTFDMASS